MDNIAVIRRNGLGDLLCAYPLILFIKKKFPLSKITLFVDQRNAPLIPYLPPVHQVVLFPGKGNKYWNFFKTAWPYRKKFDMAISAKTSPMKLNNFFLYWLKAKKSVAYVDAGWQGKGVNAPLFYDPIKAKQTHQAIKCLHTIEPALSTVPPELFPRISIPEAIKRAYPLKNIPEGPVILISATTTKEASRFSEERYASLLNKLYQSTPFGVVIVGQIQDSSRANALSKQLQMSAPVYFPRNFDEFMVLLGACDLYFVGDGGVAHIGAALGKKVVALFGETNPVEWSPLSKDAETFYHPAHVNCLSDDAIYPVLKRKLNEVMWKREFVKSSGIPSV